MSGQVLDVGDRVIHNSTRRDGVVTGVEAVKDGHYYIVEWAFHLHRQGMSRAGWSRCELTRVGGELQVGDFVRINGLATPLGLGRHVVLRGETGVIVDNIADAPNLCQVCTMGGFRVYQISTRDLTRLTRAEALA